MIYFEVRMPSKLYFQGLIQLLQDGAPKLVTRLFSQGVRGFKIEKSFNLLSWFRVKLLGSCLNCPVVNFSVKNGILWLGPAFVGNKIISHNQPKFLKCSWQKVTQNLTVMNLTWYLSSAGKDSIQNERTVLPDGRVQRYSIAYRRLAQTGGKCCKIVSCKSPLQNKTPDSFTDYYNSALYFKTHLKQKNKLNLSRISQI